MAKKRVGLAAFDKEMTDARFKTLGTDLIQTQYAQLSSQLETFQQALSVFATTHASEIRANPAFRAQFNQMCATIGLDPLYAVMDRGRTKAGRRLTEILGIGELYHDLAVQVIEICRRTRPSNGGLVTVDEVVRTIEARSAKFGNPNHIGADDVVRAVESLSCLESGIEVVTVGSALMIRSVPQELNPDQRVVLEAAQICGGHVSVSMLRLNFGWERERARSVLGDLLGAGMLWVDEQSESREAEYWTPSALASQ